MDEAGAGGTTGGDSELAVVSRVLGQVLGCGPLDPAESFIAAGGDSLRAAKALVALRRQTGARVSLSDFYADPTPRAISRLVGSAGPPPLPLPERVPRDHELPFTLRQASRLRAYGLELPPWRTAVQAAFIVDGDLDIGRLTQAANDVVRRHEALRTQVRIDDGVPRQTITSTPAPVVVAVSDLPAGQAGTAGEAGAAGQAGPVGTDQAIAAFASQHACQPFDLTHGPLLRVSVVRLGERRNLLVVATDHFVADGRTLELILLELSAGMHGKDPGPAPELHYVDFAGWQRRLTEGEPARRLAGYWREAIRGVVPQLALPPDRDTGDHRPDDGTLTELPLPDATVAAVRVGSRDANVPIFVPLAGAWAVALAVELEYAPVTVLSPYSARTQPGLEESAGDLSNSAPLIFRLRPGMTFREVVAASRTVCNGLLAAGMFPYDEIMRAGAEVGGALPDRLAEGFFSVEQTIRLSLPGARTEQVVAPVTRSYFDLSLFVVFDDDTATLRVLYKPALFSAARIGRLLDRYAHILAYGPAHPDVPIPLATDGPGE